MVKNQYNLFWSYYRWESVLERTMQQVNIGTEFSHPLFRNLKYILKHEQLLVIYDSLSITLPSMFLGCVQYSTWYFYLWNVFIYFLNRSVFVTNQQIHNYCTRNCRDLHVPHWRYVVWSKSSNYIGQNKF